MRCQVRGVKLSQPCLGGFGQENGCNLGTRDTFGTGPMPRCPSLHGEHMIFWQKKLVSKQKKYFLAKNQIFGLKKNVHFQGYTMFQQCTWKVLQMKNDHYPKWLRGPKFWGGSSKQKFDFSANFWFLVKQKISCISVFYLGNPCQTDSELFFGGLSHSLRVSSHSEPSFKVMPFYRGNFKNGQNSVFWLKNGPWISRNGTYSKSENIQRYLSMCPCHNLVESSSADPKNGQNGL